MSLYSIDPDICGHCGENIYSCNCCSECSQDIHVCGGVAFHDLVRRIPVSQSVLDEIRSLALQIAKKQRNEDHMQNITTLQRKFKAECVELAEASEQWDELPDIFYYASCLCICGCYEEMYLVANEIEKRGVSVAQLEAGTLAKYRLRASYPKSLLAERAAILDAVSKVVPPTGVAEMVLRPRCESF